MICKHCGCELEDMSLPHEAGVRPTLVDVVSGDDGGTYDYCPANPVGTEDERLHEIDHGTAPIEARVTIPAAEFERLLSED